MATKNTKVGKELKSVTKKTKDNKEIRISIEEIENGFLIRKSTDWNDPKKGWQYESKTWYSENNPLDKLEFEGEGDLADAFS